MDISEVKKIIEAGGACVSVVRAVLEKGPVFKTVIKKAPYALAIFGIQWAEVVAEAKDIDQGEAQECLSAFFEAATPIED